MAIPHDNNLPSITMLNDDCLIHVMKWFPSDDRFNFASTCHHFLLLKTPFAKIHLDDLLSLLVGAARRLFRDFGEYFREITCDAVDGKMLNYYCQFMSSYCPFLISLRINSGISERLSLDHFKSLRSLKLRANFPTRQEGEILNDYVFLNKELQILHLKSPLVTGVQLAKLTQLVEMNLEGCHNLITEIVCNILNANRNLKKLNLILTGLIGRKLQCPVEVQEKLEWLGLDSHLCDTFEESKMVSLLHITIWSYNYEIVRNFLLRLAEYRGKYLKTLKIILNLSHPIADSVREISKLYPKLERLDIINTILSNEDLKEIVRNLSRLKYLYIDSLEVTLSLIDDMVDARKTVTNAEGPLIVGINFRIDDDLKEDLESSKQWIEFVKKDTLPQDLFDGEMHCTRAARGNRAGGEVQVAMFNAVRP